MDTPTTSWSEARIIGWSAWTPTRILDHVASAHSTKGIPGDFTVIGRRERAGQVVEIIASSCVAAMPYYYALGIDGRVVHGTSVFEVVQRGGLDWCWSRRALIDLAIFGHTLDEDTLHAHVRRFPNDVVAVIRRGSMRVHEGRQWHSMFTWRGRGSLAHAAECFRSAMADVLADGEDPLVSLSGGFDSRVLLAGALAAGARPTLLTMGHEESTDRVVASEIARALGLEHRIVELRARDYLPAGETITAMTGGTKTAAHWHSYLYPRGAVEHVGPHLVGSNGEFARTFYFDRGWASHVVDTTAYAGIYAQWAARITRRIGTAARLGLVRPPLARPVGAVARRTTRLSGRSTHVLDALDSFYACQRVRHFIGNGLALYAASGKPRSPFLDARWIEASAALPRREKLGAGHHRDLLYRLWPALCQFPIGAEARVLRKAPAGAWLRHTPPSIGYSPFAEVLEMTAAKERIVECAGLDEVIPRRLRERAVAEGDEDAKELLLTLSFVVDKVSDACTG